MQVQHYALFLAERNKSSQQYRLIIKFFLRLTLIGGFSN